LPALDAPSREVLVKNPEPGQWLLEVRGARGLTAAPGVSLPTSGVAAPGPVDGTITQLQSTLSPIADIQGHPAQSEIEKALKARLIDTFSDGTFRPDSPVTREDFARTLMLDTPLRQTLGAAPKFTDVNGSLAAIAEAVTANGSTLRDWDFTPRGMISASGNTFNPIGTVSRLDLVVALVRALGLDAEARAKANTQVTSGGTPLSDNAAIPGDLRGYVQIAIDKGLLEVYPAEVRQIGPGQFIALPGPRVEANTVVTRASLAAEVNKFSQLFIAGN
jgi:serine protease AprX